MAKTKQQKQNTITSLADSFKKAKSAVFANFQGLTVLEVEDLRNKCREENIDVKAAKKTLVKLACAESGVGDVETRAFEGGVGVFVGTEDEVAPARIVHNFSKTHKVVNIFGGILEGKYVDADQIKSLAMLPSRDELLAKVVGSINAPVSGFVNVLAGNIRNLVSVLNNIKEAKI